MEFPLTLFPVVIIKAFYAKLLPWFGFPDWFVAVFLFLVLRAFFDAILSLFFDAPPSPPPVLPAYLRKKKKKKKKKWKSSASDDDDD